MSEINSNDSLPKRSSVRLALPSSITSSFATVSMVIRITCSFLGRHPGATRQLRGRCWFLCCKRVTSSPREPDGARWHTLRIAGRGRQDVELDQSDAFNLRTDQ